MAYCTPETLLSAVGEAVGEYPAVPYNSQILDISPSADTIADMDIISSREAARSYEFYYLRVRDAADASHLSFRYHSQQVISTPEHDV